MKVVEWQHFEDNWHNACVYSSETDKRYWLDVEVSDDGIERAEWNQYIFHHSNRDDMERRAFQDDPDNYLEALRAIEDYYDRRVPTC